MVQWVHLRRRADGRQVATYAATLLLVFAAAAFAATPVPNITVAPGHADSHHTPAITAVVEFTEPITGLSASDFTIASAGAVVVSRVLTGAGTSWELLVTLQGGIHAGCPEGYVASPPSSSRAPTCGRAVSSAASWLSQQAACAPHALASISSPAEAAFFRSLASDGVDHWYACAWVMVVHVPRC